MPDELCMSVIQQFFAKELVDVTLAVIAINGCNRLAISFRTVPGTYKAHTVAPISQALNSPKPSAS
jgi:hypothetical protein